MTMARSSPSSGQQLNAPLLDDLRALHKNADVDRRRGADGGWNQLFYVRAAVQYREWFAEERASPRRVGLNEGIGLERNPEHFHWRRCSQLDRHRRRVHIRELSPEAQPYRANPR